jgi:hypothetical protein
MTTAAGPIMPVTGDRRAEMIEVDVAAPGTFAPDPHRLFGEAW